METNARFPYRKTFFLAFGFFGISLIWPLFNNFVPIFLKGFGLSATAVGFVMTWDNYLNMFVQPIVGERSDHTRTRWGRRKPWMLAGAPLAAVFFIFIPAMRTVSAVMFAILLTNFGMALFRAPTVALLGDVFEPHQRSTANGVINFMGGVGAIVAFLVGGMLYKIGRITPFAFGSVMMLISVAVVILFIKEPEAPPVIAPSERTSFLENLREVVGAADRSGLYILLAILFWFISYNAIETWLSSFGKYSLGIDEGRMAILTSGLALTFVIFAIPSGVIATKFGRRRVILAGIAGMTLLFVFGFFVTSEAMLIPLLILAGMCWALINVNSLPMVYDVGGDHRIGAFTGMYYLASNIAAVAGPQVVGILIDLNGGNYRIMWAFSVVFMLLAGWMMSRVHESAPAAKESHA